MSIGINMNPKVTFILFTPRLTHFTVTDPGRVRPSIFISVLYERLVVVLISPKSAGV